MSTTECAELNQVRSTCYANCWAWEIGPSVSDGWQAAAVRPCRERKWVTAAAAAKAKVERLVGNHGARSLTSFPPTRRWCVACCVSSTSFSAHTAAAFRAARPANGPTATCGTCLLSFCRPRVNRSKCAGDIGPRFLRHKGIRSLIPPVVGLPLSREIEWLKWSADGQTKSKGSTQCPRSRLKPQTRNFTRSKGSRVFTQTKKIAHTDFVIMRFHCTRKLLLEE